jgi:hypothetical protein
VRRVRLIGASVVASGTTDGHRARDRARRLRLRCHGARVGAGGPVAGDPSPRTGRPSSPSAARPRVVLSVRRSSPSAALHVEECRQRRDLPARWCGSALRERPACTISGASRRRGRTRRRSGLTERRTSPAIRSIVRCRQTRRSVRVVQVLGAGLPPGAAGSDRSGSQPVPCPLVPPTSAGRCAGSGVLPRMRSAAFSASIIVGAWVALLGQ